MLNPLGKSDHLMMKIVTSSFVKLEDRPNRLKQLLHKGDYNGMREELCRIDWSYLFRERNVDQCWNDFCAKLLHLQETMIPQVSAGKHTRPQWMDQRARLAIKAKQSAWKKYMICRTDSNFDKYKKARNRFKSVSIKARRSFEKKISEEVKVNPKAFWNYVSQKTKVVSLQQKVRNERGELSRNSEETAEFLNSYFVSVFDEDDPENTHYPYPCPESTCSNLSEINISKDDIIKILGELKIDKAAGPDGILPRVLYETRYQIAPALQIIFRRSLAASRLPQEWKNAVIVPIHKNGRKDIPCNYRPISLTSIVCKVMEKIVREAIMNHLYDNNILSDKQYGFVPGRSCTLQLLVSLEDWITKLDEGASCDVIYTDFSKAFDKVSHKKLILKLETLGIRGRVIKWIENFLTDRHQKVRVNEQCSGWQTVKSGVPQGSVLGPILFLVFINDLPDAIKNKLIKLFADDAKLYNVSTSLEDCVQLQQNLDSLIKWSSEWSLRVNPEKCKVLHLSKGNPDRNYQYHMQVEDTETYLEEVPYQKDLGIFMDSRLSFETHITKSVSKANRMLGLVRRNFKYVNEEVFCNLYKTLVRPHVEYGSVVWNPKTKRDQRKLEGIQRRATKIIPRLTNLSYDERLRILGLPTLEYRRLRADMIQVFKIFKGFDRVNKCKYIL